MTRIVADSSVLVKWFTGERERLVKNALTLLENLKEGKLKVLTSDLAPHEISNALWKKKKLSLDKAQLSFEILFKLPIEIIKTDTRILSKAFQIAKEVKITSYDAVFIAIALLYDCPLITANPKHQQKFKKAKIIPLSEY